MQELVISELEVWRGDYRVCAGWDARVEAGQMLLLRGENGAGKTSLMRIFAGLARPENGTVRYGVRGWTPQSVSYRDCLRYVAHRDGIKQELSTRENLRLCERLLTDSTPGEVNAVLAHVGLGGLGARRTAELSAGQRRRLALARLLLGRASLWLLDEPLVSLDRAGVALVAELLRKHLADGGIAVVATHQTLPLSGLNVIALDLPQGPRNVH